MDFCNRVAERLPNPIHSECWWEDEWTSVGTVTAAEWSDDREGWVLTQQRVMEIEGHYGFSSEVMSSTVVLTTSALQMLNARAAEIDH